MSKATPDYPVSQAELDRYKQLETVVRRYSRDLELMRQSLYGRIGQPLAVEPGPYQVLVFFMEPPAPVARRHLLVYEIDEVM